VVILILPLTERKKKIIIHFLLIGQATFGGPRSVPLDVPSRRACLGRQAAGSSLQALRDEQSPSVGCAAGVSGCQLPVIYYWFAVYREAGQAITNNSVQMVRERKIKPVQREPLGAEVLLAMPGIVPL